MAPEEAPPRLPEAGLPDYTLLVPLYREDRVLPHLIQRLDGLAYPAPRKQVLFLVEADDWETRANLAMLNLPPGFLIFTVPEGAPRTKPTGTQCRITLCAGHIDHGLRCRGCTGGSQLRLAAETFANAPPAVGCLQARLAIANQADSWVTRRFAQIIWLCSIASNAALLWRDGRRVGRQFKPLQNRDLARRGRVGCNQCHRRCRSPHIGWPFSGFPLRICPRPPGRKPRSASRSGVTNGSAGSRAGIRRCWSMAAIGNSIGHGSRPSGVHRRTFCPGCLDDVRLVHAALRTSGWVSSPVAASSGRNSPWQVALDTTSSSCSSLA